MVREIAGAAEWLDFTQTSAGTGGVAELIPVHVNLPALGKTTLRPIRSWFDAVR